MDGAEPCGKWSTWVDLLDIRTLEDHHRLIIFPTTSHDGVLTKESYASTTLRQREAS